MSGFFDRLEEEEYPRLYDFIAASGEKREQANVESVICAVDEQEDCSLSADADDDMVVELAFAAQCRRIITHNLSDFRGTEAIGITATSPRDFLEELRRQP